MSTCGEQLIQQHSIALQSLFYVLKNKNDSSKMHTGIAPSIYFTKNAQSVID